MVIFYSYVNVYQRESQGVLLGILSLDFMVLCLFMDVKPWNLGLIWTGLITGYLLGIKMG